MGQSGRAEGRTWNFSCRFRIFGGWLGGLTPLLGGFQLGGFFSGWVGLGWAGGLEKWIYHEGKLVGGCTWKPRCVKIRAQGYFSPFLQDICFTSCSSKLFELYGEFHWHVIDFFKIDFFINRRHQSQPREGMPTTYRKCYRCWKAVHSGIFASSWQSHWSVLRKIPSTICWGGMKKPSYIGHTCETEGIALRNHQEFFPLAPGLFSDHKYKGEHWRCVIIWTGWSRHRLCIFCINFVI